MVFCVFLRLRSPLRLSEWNLLTSLCGSDVAVKQSAIFTEFRTHSTDSKSRRLGKKQKPFRSQMILKVIF